MANIIIEGSEWVRYNANTSANNVGDCVKRALSLAFNLSYSTVGKQLAQLSNELNKEWDVNTLSYSSKFVYGRWLKEQGLTKYPITIPLDEITTLDEFADAHSQGTWLVETGKKKDGPTTHIVVIIDGRIYDSWDSRDQYAHAYWEVPEVTHSFGENVDLDNYRTFLREQTQELGLKYLSKYDLYDDVIDGPFIRIFINGEFNAAVKYRFTMQTDYAGTKMYEFRIGITVPPTTSQDEVEKTILQTLKVRMYDRFYEIGKQNAKLKLAAKAASNGRSMHPDLEHYWKYMSRLERSFFNSLPAEIQPKITDISVQSPGTYSDSYTVHYENDDGTTHRLYALTAGDMRDIIKHYHETGEDLSDAY